MEYEEYVQFCLDTYKEGLDKSGGYCDLLEIVVGNLSELKKTYISPRQGEVEDLVNDIYLDVLMLMDEEK